MADRRRYVYIPKRTREEQEARPRYDPIPCEECPRELWSVPQRGADEQPWDDMPLLHGRTAFAEERGHDWSWRGGSLRYHPGGDRSGGVWLCLVFSEVV